MERKTMIIGAIEVEAAYYYYPPCRGARERSGLQIESDEPASVELQWLCIGGQDVSDIVQQSFWDACEEELMQQISDDIQGEQAAYADAMYDEWKERNRYEMP